MNPDSLRECAKKFGTPTYCYDADNITQQYQKLKLLVDAGCRIHYSLKANPSLGILKKIRMLGMSCDVSSKHEIQMALMAGFLPAQIVFVGPGKTEDELACAIDESVGLIVCESVKEIAFIDHYAKTAGKVVKVLVRLNPDFKLESSAMRMSGVASQFGIDLKTFQQHISRIKQFKHINLTGIHVYSGTRILDHQAIIDNTKMIFNLALTLKKQYQINIDIVDIGGGFGVPYFAHEKQMDIKKLVAGILAAVKCFKEDSPDSNIIIELGRFLVAESGSLITKVIHQKETHGKHYLVLDGGMYCNYAMSLQGALIHKNFPILALGKAIKSMCRKVYQLAGPSCSPGDLLGINVELPEVQEGDYIVFEKVGAYGLTASPGRFISHGVPAEVMCENSKKKLIRRRENFLDLINTQII